VAEFAVALIQTLNRKTHRAYTRVREGNFNIDGFTGYTLHGKTVGIIGIGKIGMALARILQGFGCHLLAYDPYPNQEFEKYGKLVSLDELLAQSHIVSLHCPLSKNTRYIINDQNLGKMKKGALLVNTSRGGLVDTKAAIAALKTKQLGGLALDVYEAECSLFYDDHSSEIIQDDNLMRLMTFPNALMCGHQAFLTAEALTQIAEVTFRNLDDFASQRKCENSLVQGRNILVTDDIQPVRI
jgi:D-lactate dehydrogenase